MNKGGKKTTKEKGIMTREKPKTIMPHLKAFRDRLRAF